MSIKYEASFVSAVRSYGNLGPFRPIDKEMFRGVRILDMILRPQQIVCASGVPQNKETHLYGNWGVVIGQGDILQAYPYDATSYIDTGQIKSPYQNRISEVGLDEQIEGALDTLPTHNEINISLGSKSIAGFFYQPHPRLGIDDSHFPSEAIEDLLSPLNIPAFWLDRGNYYEKTTDTPPTDLSSPIPLREVLSTQETINESVLEPLKSFLISELTLPPRNPITSGVLRARSAVMYANRHGSSIDSFVADTEKHLASESEDVKLYGAVAVHAFGQQQISSNLSIPEHVIEQANAHLSAQEFKTQAARILDNGNISITQADLDHYLAFSTLPGYLGKI